jgi:hypothetical protein
MKVRTRAVAAIAAATTAALVGVSAPAYASVDTRPAAASVDTRPAVASADAPPAAAASAQTVRPYDWYIAGFWKNNAMGWAACYGAGVALKLGGQISDYYCTLDEQSNLIFLYVYV